MLRWERLAAFDDEDELSPDVDMWRTEVPGGWIVLAQAGDGLGTTFYPDPEHKWRRGVETDAS